MYFTKSNMDFYLYDLYYIGWAIITRILKPRWISQFLITESATKKRGSCTANFPTTKGLAKFKKSQLDTSPHSMDNRKLSAFQFNGEQQNPRDFAYGTSQSDKFRWVCIRNQSGVHFCYLWRQQMSDFCVLYNSPSRPPPKQHGLNWIWRDNPGFEFVFFCRYTKNYQNMKGYVVKTVLFLNKISPL